MSACKVADAFGPVMVGTTKLSTKIVITIANIPSVRPSVRSFLNQEETFSLIALNHPVAFANYQFYDEKFLLTAYALFILHFDKQILRSPYTVANFVR